MFRVGLVAAIGLLVACKSSPAGPPRPVGELESPLGRIILEQSVIAGDLRGISGVALAGAGRLWLVPERDRRLFEIAWGPDGGRVLSVRPIRGAPDGQDLESVTQVPGGPTLAFGTETSTPRTADRILFGRVSDEGVVFDRVLALDYGPWQVTPGRNHGLEALCTAGDHLVALSETVKVRDHARLAPIATRRVNAPDAWLRGVVALTSDEGKISAVACRMAPGPERVIDAVAIERHYGVMRLIRFQVPTSTSSAPADPLAAPIAPSILVDLGPAYREGTPPNFEGLAWLDARTLLLVSDNDYGGVSGPTVALRVQLP